MAQPPRDPRGPDKLQTINSSKFCTLSGGKVPPEHPTQCVGSASSFPDPESCGLGGPNVQQWRPGVGCVFDMVAGCVNGSTFDSWHWKGDDLMCVYGISNDMCGAAIKPPTLDKPAAFASAGK
jgi:hypothetical protein